MIKGVLSAIRPVLHFLSKLMQLFLSGFLFIVASRKLAKLRNRIQPYTEASSFHVFVFLLLHLHQQGWQLPLRTLHQPRHMATNGPLRGKVSGMTTHLINGQLRAATGTAAIFPSHTTNFFANIVASAKGAPRLAQNVKLPNGNDNSK